MGNFTRRFLGRNVLEVGQKEVIPMTRKKLRLLRDLLDELLEDEQRTFAHDTGIEPDSEEYARMARKYLGRELPRLGEIRVDAIALPSPAAVFPRHTGGGGRMRCLIGAVFGGDQR